jgi:hypothetical protein
VTRSWSFTLPYIKPPKGTNANDTGSKWYRINATKQVRQDTYFLTKAAKIPKLERCRVDVEWIVNTHRNRDASNLGLFTKPIYDAIGAKHDPSAHVVPDDSPAYMETPTPTIRYARDETARFVVTITELPTLNSELNVAGVE